MALCALGSCVRAMWHYQSVESFADRPEGYLDGGHFWIREFVTGGVFAVRMAESGLLAMAGPDGDFGSTGPWPYRRAIEATRDEFDRDGLRAAVEDVTRYTFYVLAPLSVGIEYEWEAMPALFGLEIWDATAESFLPVDVADRAFEELGLWPIPTVEREVHARDLQVGTENIPEAAFGSVTAAGIELRKKRGDSVAILRPEFESVTRAPPGPAGSPEALDPWLEDRLDADSVVALHESGDRPLDAWSLEEQTTEVAAELARRRFDEVGFLVLSEPERFEEGVRDRLVSLRRASTR
ncbi:MAG: hypothetical protein ABEJ84_01870 [Halodesulfurarchaeum sp.]